MLHGLTQRALTAFRLPNLVVISRNLAVADTTTKRKDNWDLYAAVLVERLPIISKPLNKIEKEFQDVLWRIEYEKSFKSNHEIQYERELAQAELIKKGEVEVDLEDSSSKQTAQDLKDAYTEELKQFKFASRQTADDSTNNVASTNRSLEDTLYLLVEQKLGKQTHFLLPQGVRVDGETMRQAAERILHEKCGDKMQVTFYGNAPCGFYKYKYPMIMREQSVGAKIFFYRAALQRGNVNKELGHKFEWLVKDALDGKLKNNNYAESVHKFLL